MFVTLLSDDYVFLTKLRAALWYSLHFFQ